MDWGIVTRVVDDESLATEAAALAAQIAAGPTIAFGSVKKLLAASLQNPLETQLELESQAISEAAVSRDGREGVAAFFAKRAAIFSGD